MKPDRFEQARIDKLQKIKELGHDPFGQLFENHALIREVRTLAPAENGVLGAETRVAGRIMLRRKAGKLRFFDIEDATGKIQLLFSRGDLSEAQWELMGQLDLGDLVGIDGRLKRTDTGEISIQVQTLTVLCKSLTQPPEKHHGLTDVETLLRHRELDLIYTDGVRDKLLLRSQILGSIRRTLAARDFVEVETPVLHAIAGGAAARPFTTHHNALDIPLFLRIALELHLKRLMVGGIERVYEIGRVFRNEGVDATHNPEFTMIELYQAYGNYETMMDVVEAIVSDAAQVVLSQKTRIQEPESNINASASATSGEAAVPHRLVLPWGDGEIDFTPPWPRRTYTELFEQYAGCSMSDGVAVQAKAREQAKLGKIKPEFIKQMDGTGVHADVIISEVFEACVEDALIGPVFVIDYPASLCPLTKRKQSNRRLPNVSNCSCMAWNWPMPTPN